MKSTIILIAALCGAIPTFAQIEPTHRGVERDSTSLDLGYLTLPKAFTQRLVIRGADLEKMPFTNLSDAIGAWLYGVYSNPVTLVYVVDGNPVADVNAYAIYDIDEVVLVQDAAGLIATAPGQAETVLIRTKRGKGPGGITAAAQTGYVTANGNGYISDPQLFHNYYLSGYRNLGKLGFGVSANYIRDVLPGASAGEKEVTPNNWQRWRLNGYVDWRPDAHNLVEVTINYTPEQLNGQQDSTRGLPGSYGNLVKGHQHFVLPHLDWRSEWGKGFTNDLQGTYLHSNLTSEDAEAFDTTGGQLVSQTTKSYHLWIRDHFAYSATLGGGWMLEPSLNISFEHISDAERELYASVSGIIPSLMLNPYNYSAIDALQALAIKSTIFLLVPAVDLSYKGAIDLRAGAMIHTGTQSLTGNGREVYPYGGLTVDLLRLADEHSHNSLKLSGSAASCSAPSDNIYSIADFSNGALYSSPYPSYNNNVLGGSGPYGPPAGYVFPVPPLFLAWEAGVSYTGWGGRLQLAYTYERRVTTTYGAVQLSNGWVTVNYVDWHSSLHHADLRIAVLDGPGVSWRTGVNATLLRSVASPNSAFEVVEPSVGDIAPQPWSATGGWVNRVQIKEFSAGLDFIYHFGGGSEFVTPNGYLGYRFRFAHERTFEVFVDSRGLIRNGYSNLSDIRRYYTLGGKLAI